jgi:hypothetical protein
VAAKEKRPISSVTNEFPQMLTNTLAEKDLIRPVAFGCSDE